MKKMAGMFLGTAVTGFVLLVAIQFSYGEEMKCKECHEDQMNSFLSSHHNKAWTAKDGASAKSCEACHGPTEKHIEAGGGVETIISFTKNSKQTATDMSKQCLTCHSKLPHLMNWDIGKHKKNDVSCVACHNVHVPRAQMKPKPETCFTCHKDIKSQVNRLSHHPIMEGKVGCADCHNPHGENTKSMIKASTINQLCYKCHSDKRGPFMWEHPPVEENCTTCHAVHGSQHRSLLVQKSPNLCQNCHHAGGHPNTMYTAYSAPGRNSTPSPQMLSRGCINCHVKIHGSNAPNNPGKNAYMNGGNAFLR